MLYKSEQYIDKNDYLIKMKNIFKKVLTSGKVCVNISLGACQKHINLQQFVKILKVFVDRHKKICYTMFSYQRI